MAYKRVTEAERWLIYRWRQWLNVPHYLGHDLRVDGVHGTDKGSCIPLCAANAGDALRWLSRLDDSRQLIPATQAIRLMLCHGQNAARSVMSKELEDAGRHRVAVGPLVQHLQGDQGIQQNGNASFIALQATSNYISGQMGSAEDIEEFQIGGGRQHAGRLKTAGEAVNLINSPLLGHQNLRWD